jgi:hypothetical protein
MHGFDELNECMWTWIDTDLNEYSRNTKTLASRQTAAAKKYGDDQAAVSNDMVEDH